MKVLYLTEWYPHRYDAMSGLFVHKHAAASVGAGVDVCVLYLFNEKSQRTMTTNRVGIEVVEQLTDGVREVYVYYNKGTFLSALRRGWREVQERWGTPDLCQLNVLTKNVLLPLWLRLTRHTPYIVVEHWSGYLPQNGKFAMSSVVHRSLARLAVRKASAVMPVSEVLERSMRAQGFSNKRWLRLNNVVDDIFYNVECRPHSIKSFLHVSCFDERAKNVRGLLRAVRILADKRDDFRLVLVGTGVDYADVREYAESLGFPRGMLQWKGELPLEGVAECFAEADAFVLFSNYETAGVVLAESLAAGCPIVSTPVGIAPQIITDKTGVLVPIGDESALAEALEGVMTDVREFDRKEMRRRANIYSYDSVGDCLLRVYQSVI